jgi:hypothetical protein
MRGITQFALIIPGLLIIGLASLALNNSVSGLSTRYNITPPVDSKLSPTTQRVAQVLYHPINSNPFGEIQKMNFSNTLISQDKHLINDKPHINSFKGIMKSEIKNRFKLPIDIPFP